MKFTCVTKCTKYVECVISLLCTTMLYGKNVTGDRRVCRYPGPASTPHVPEVDHILYPVLWPNGQVYYRIDESLGHTDKLYLHRALQEYMWRTCLKFEVALNQSVKHIVVKIDESVDCGNSEVCFQKISTNMSQYLMVTKRCSNKQTFIHELGHAVCLTHVHIRYDRDLWVSYAPCPDPPTPHPRVNNRIYDLTSAMHEKCNSCHGGFVIQDTISDRCGEQVHDSLSTTDVDTINDFYGCDKCLSHRWRPLPDMKLTDWESVADFSFPMDNNGKYAICRTSFQGEILVGFFEETFSKCVVLTGAFKLVISSIYIEILLLADTLNDRQFYRMTDEFEYIPEEIAVAVGTVYDNAFKAKEGYLMFGKIESHDVMLHLELDRIDHEREMIYTSIMFGNMECDIIMARNDDIDITDMINQMPNRNISIMFTGISLESNDTSGEKTLIPTEIKMLVCHT